MDVHEDLVHQDGRGIAPGAEVTLVERRPSRVLRLGETERALDMEIAKEILVACI